LTESNWCRSHGFGFHPHAQPVTKLQTIGTVGQRNTGTTVRFWPDPKFFDSPNFSAPQLKHVLKAKAVLCPGLRMKFFNEATGEKDERRMQDLAEAVHLSQSALSRVVARLEADGLVVRAMCAEDRRGIFACLTDAGRERHAAARPAHRAVLAAALDA